MPVSPRRLVAGYPELSAVVVAAAVGLGVRPPLRWWDDHGGVDTALVVLVLATAVTVDPASLRRVGAGWRRLLLVLAAGVTVLPALAWVASRTVAAGSLRDGVLSVGVAPCEIASVATTAMAGGAAAVSAGLLVGSTLATIVLAGPVLSLEAGGAGVHDGHLAVSLALIVALPLAAGLVLRAAVPAVAGAAGPAGATATVAVAALVALIAADVHASLRYAAVVAALAGFLAASALLGRVLAVAGEPGVGVAVVLTTSMRDFAVAAGIATAAFGPDAAAPLGAYGILVLVWGTAAAGTLRRRDR